jgi:hypothetical protein
MYEAPERTLPGGSNGLWDSSGIGPLFGSAAPDYFQPVEQAPSHILRAGIAKAVAPVKSELSNRNYQTGN